MYRYLDRLTGDPDLAADLAQDTFIRLYRRGTLPDEPRAWLITVGLNLFRNAKTMRSRRLRLLTVDRGTRSHSDASVPADAAEESAETRRRVRAALDRLPERERHLLLLRAEGYSYKELAAALELNEASVGVMLARARTGFRGVYDEAADVR